MKIFWATIIALFLSGCAINKDVTSVHPARDNLLGESISEVPVYLYKDNKSTRYTLLTYEIVTYHYENGNQIRNVYPADHVFSPGVKIKIEKIALVADMSSAQRIELFGTLVDDQKSYPIQLIHEYVGIDPSEWQKTHGILSSPKTPDYLGQSSRTDLPWMVNDED